MPASRPGAAESLPAPHPPYAAGTEVEHFADFCRQHLIQSIDAWDGLPLELEPPQMRMFGEALAYGPDGWPMWNSVIIIAPRKNGKTVSLAAYGLYRLLTSDGFPEILLAASSDKQAGRLFDACASFVRRSPTLAKLCRIRDYVGEIVREDGRGQILRMSSDPARLHGYNPSLVIVDELAQWTTPTLKRAYAALTSGGGARSAPQVFTITTAGEAHYRHDSILGRILDAGLAADPEHEPGLHICRLWNAKTLIWDHEAPTDDPMDVAAMKLANPASWITEEYLLRQAQNPELSKADVLQLHGCVWAEGESYWLPAGSWDPLADTKIVPEPLSEVVLAFDGSYNGDSSALVGATCGEKPHVFVVDVWEKPPHDDEWIVPREQVKARVAKTMEAYRVREFACDPPGWHAEIEEWAERYSDSVVIRYETNRRKQMSDACSRFFTAVVNGDMTHDGNADLARHLGNCVVKETTDGAYITKDGRHSPRKIDLAVAAVVAYDRASQQTGGGLWKYAA